MPSLHHMITTINLKYFFLFSYKNVSWNGSQVHNCLNSETQFSSFPTFDVNSKTKENCKTSLYSYSKRKKKERVYKTSLHLIQILTKFGVFLSTFRHFLLLKNILKGNPIRALALTFIFLSSVVCLFCFQVYFWSAFSNSLLASVSLLIK